MSPPTPLCMPGWAKMPAELLIARISDRAKLLWAVLERHQGGQGASWPSRAHLAGHLGCSVDSVDRAIAELVDKGWLVVERSPGGRYAPNLYVVIHNDRTGAAVTASNGRTRDPVEASTAAPVRPATAAPVRHRRNSREGATEGHSTAQGATARVCELGHPKGADGTCCPDHDAQRPIWPVAVTQK